MFSHKVRCFPQGTFLPMPLRVLAIVHLCIVFTVLFAHCGYPFMGELYEVKSRMLLSESIMKSEHFEALPLSDQAGIQTHYEQLQERMQGSFMEKLVRSFRIIVYDLPLFEQGWIIFSVVIPLMLLLRVNGAASAVWILPLLVVAYSVDNRLNGYERENPDITLFPSESHIVTEYLDKPLSKEISLQREELVKGWQLYLVDRWAGERPSEDSEVYMKQVKKGEFRFNVERDALLSKSPVKKDYFVFRERQSLFLLGIYIFWNVFFAYYARFSRYG